jgi:hypothetical protein
MRHVQLNVADTTAHAAARQKARLQKATSAQSHRLRKMRYVQNIVTAIASERIERWKRGLRATAIACTSRR